MINAVKTCWKAWFHYFRSQVRLCRIYSQNNNTNRYPLAVKAKSYIKDSRHFKQMLKEVNVEEHFIQLSFDIRSLFPSIPIKPTLSLIHKKLQNDKMLSERTRWKPKNIVNLIQICTEETHFKDFEGKI